MTPSVALASRSLQLCSSLEATTGHLNSSQREAIKRTMQAEDYSLLLGMPGTGKTDTIATLAKSAAESGHTVLLTGYTHASVDNVLERLLDLGETRILRLGNASQVCRSPGPDRQCLMLKGPWFRGHSGF